MLTELLDQLEKHGHKVRIVSIKHISVLKQKIIELYDKGLFYEEFYKEYLTGFDFKLPDNNFEANSLIIVATPQPIIHVTFRWNGKSIFFAIPPAYSHESDKYVVTFLNGFIRPHKYQILKAKLPLKTLAVHSGLAKYGKNNIAYVEGMGSFFRLTAFFSNLPHHGDISLSPQMMKRCNNCVSCLINCPTRALSSERFLLYAERCITFHNERQHDFPSWLEPGWHNCLVGCLYCQVSCPENREYRDWIENTWTFSENETASLLQKRPIAELSSETIEKIEQLGLTEYVEILPRNINALFNRASVMTSKK